MRRLASPSTGSAACARASASSRTRRGRSASPRASTSEARPGAVPSGMRTTRRTFVRAAGAGAVGAALPRGRARAHAPAVVTSPAFDVAVVGAGVFGSWAAHDLAKAGGRVALVDAYGPGNARASSGGQTRVFWMGSAAPEIYTRWSMRSLERWTELFREAGRPACFQRAG